MREYKKYLNEFNLYEKMYSNRRKEKIKLIEKDLSLEDNNQD
jgi:hypothetical protein